MSGPNKPGPRELELRAMREKRLTTQRIKAEVARSAIASVKPTAGKIKGKKPFMKRGGARRR